MPKPEVVENRTYKDYFIYFILYELFGILLFEWAWSKTFRARKIDEARDSNFPAWRRLDTTKWSRLRFYPGAITILPLRLFSMILLAIVTYPLIRIIYFGVDLTKKIPENRQRFLQTWYVWVAQRFLDIFLIVTKDRKSNANFDYSYYLGPDYRKDLK